MKLFAPRVTPPFGNYPRTIRKTDRKGRVRYIVDIKYLHPFGAKCGDLLGQAFAAALLFGGGYLLIRHNVAEWWMWGAVLVPPFALLRLWQHLFRKLLRIRTRVIICRDFVRFGKRRLPRDTVEGFAEFGHDYANEEQRRATYRQQQAQRSGRAALPPRLYYGPDTRLIGCKVPGAAYTVCTIYGLRDANNIRIRLNGINDALNAERGAGLGRPIDASADTPAGRGGIPA
ncbi:MAG: hypothetical protein IT557_17395 [Alphaproteobacteria bacterium]|nr:hypothetical protein [Alphaproteobacteria bacterium]